MWPCTPLTVSVPDSVPRRPFLIMSPSALDRRRLADDAVVDALAARGEPLDDADGAVDRRAFLVGGEEQRDRAGRGRVRGDEGLDRRDERRERALHVGGAAAVEPAVALVGRERVAIASARRGPVGTTSVWPAKQTSGRASPRRAQRLVTPLATSVSHAKPSGARRAAISAWQPASSGVSERRAISVAGEREGRIAVGEGRRAGQGARRSRFASHGGGRPAVSAGGRAAPGRSSSP